MSIDILTCPVKLYPPLVAVLDSMQLKLFRLWFEKTKL